MTLNCVASPVGDGECEVTVATRKKCPACRFQKCRRVGMTHSKTSASAKRVANVTRSGQMAPSKPKNSASQRDVDGLDDGYGNGEEPVRFPKPVIGLPPDFTEKDELLMAELFRLDRTQSFYIGEAVGEVTGLKLP